MVTGVCELGVSSLSDLGSPPLSAVSAWRWGVLTLLRRIRNVPPLQYEMSSPHEDPWLKQGAALYQASQQHTMGNPASVTMPTSELTTKALLTHGLLLSSGALMFCHSAATPQPEPTDDVGIAPDWAKENNRAGAPSDDSTLLPFLRQIVNGVTGVLTMVDRSLQFPAAGALPLADTASVPPSLSPSRHSPQLRRPTSQAGLRRKQRNAIRGYLVNKGFLAHSDTGGVSAKTLVVALLDYLRQRTYGVKNAARVLQRSAGAWGSKANETCTPEMQRAVIDTWIAREVFGRSVEQFIVQQIRQNPASGNWDVHQLHQVLHHWLYDFFGEHHGDANASFTRARDDVWQAVVLRQLPLLRFRTHDAVKPLKLQDFAWGDMHAGLLLAQHLGQDLTDMLPEEAAALGQLITAALRTGDVPPLWAAMFSLPALFYQASFPSAAMPRRQQALVDYFKAQDTAFDAQFPIKKLKQQMDGFKTRSALEYDDVKFDAQNNDIADNFAQITRFAIGGVLMKLNAADYAFFSAATIDKIDAEFSPFVWWHTFGMEPMEAELSRRLRLIKLPPTVDLLLVKNAEQERIYALLIDNDGARLLRMNDTEDYYAIFSDQRPRVDSGYQLTVYKNGANIKQAHDLLSAALDNIVRLRRGLIKQQLHRMGYERTTLEILTDLAWGLVPLSGCFRTPDEELVEKVEHCITDVMALIIPVTELSMLSVRAFELFSHGAWLAARQISLRYAVHALLQGGGTQFAKNAVYFSHALFLQEIGWATYLQAVAKVSLSGGDILFSLGRFGVKRLVVLGRGIADRLPALSRPLRRVTEQTLQSLPQRVNLMDLGRVQPTGMTPVPLGFDVASRLPVVAMSETGFGRLPPHRYYALTTGELQPVPRNRKLKLINLTLLKQGLGGRGGQVQGQIWGQLSRQEAGASSSAGHSVIMKPVNAAVLRRVENLRVLGIDIGGRATIAKSQGVSEEVLARFMYKDGRLNAAGRVLLKSSEPVVAPIRAVRDLVLGWYRMTPSERESIGGVEGYVARYNLHPNKLLIYIKADGSLNASGQRLIQSNVPPPNTGISGQDQSVMQHYNSADGGMPKRVAAPTTQGESLRHDAPRVMPPRVPAPQAGVNGALSPPHDPVRPEMPPRVPAPQVGVNGVLSRLHGPVSPDMPPRVPAPQAGVNGALSPPRDPVSPEMPVLVSAPGIWEQLLSGGRDRVMPELVPAPNIVASGNSVQTGELAIPGRKRPAEADLPVVPVGDIDIKIESPDEDITPPKRQHVVNDNLPILQHPDNPQVSLLAASEGDINRIGVKDWGKVLRDEFARLPPESVTTIKEGIKADMKTWLRSEGQHQARFQAMLAAAVDVDGPIPSGQMSVFAKVDIPQFTVIGPYSGKLHISTASLQRQAVEETKHNVMAYFWHTSAQRGVSAFGSGNTLSLINSGALPGQTAIGENNVAEVFVGKNLVFYVAAKDVKQGEQLFIHYGENYAP